MRRNLLLIAILVVLCLLVVPVSADQLDSNWSYRKSHTINNTGSELTNYQMMHTINRSSGTDSGSTVYVGTKCNESYDDIRFTTDDGTTLLDYWIEESDSESANIWVEVDTIAASDDTTIYLYYGNSSATAVSSGDDTFDFFDDFPGSSLDTEKWDVGLGVFVVSDSKVTLSGNSYAATDLTFGTNVIIEGYGKIDENVYNYFGLNIGSKYARWFGHYGDYTNQHIARSANTGDESSLSADIDDTSYHRWSVGRTTSSFKYFRNGGLVATHTTQYFSDAANIRIGGDSGAAWEMDWILIRKYAATEPTHTTWGEEETQYEITADFSGVPTSGYVPLTVYFTDSSASTGNETVIIDEWSWDFGDESAGSSDQNPAHQYTTSGTYTVALTASNATHGTTDIETKTDYITVSIDPSAPTADFITTLLCEDIGEPIYFLDYSTGGGLYAWNWSFGDGLYSELRNPTHSYSANGTYDIGLTVWGANGTDTETKTGYITIPCGAPTPTPTTTATTATPTPTPTSSVTQGVLTEENITYIYSDEDQYVPLPLWLSVIGVMIAFFGHSIIFRRNTDLTATIACVLAFVAAGISNMIGYIDINVADINTTDVVVTTTIKAVHPPWLVWVMVMFAFVSIINVIYQAWKLYLKPKNWNEIYAKKYERY